MSDTTYIFQISGAQLASIEQNDDEITLHFSEVRLIQEMEATFEDSLWTQAVDLTVKGITLEGDLPECPCEITGGEMIDNIYTYRGHAPLPIDWRGEVACTLIPGNAGTGFSMNGDVMQLKQIGSPRYIKHVKKD